jgi:transposase
MQQSRGAAAEDCAAVEIPAVQPLLRESGMTQPAIAAAMGVSLSTVNRAHMAYDDGGIKAPRASGADGVCSPD